MFSERAPLEKLLKDRIVYLGSEIDDGVANVVIAQMLYLQDQDRSAPITLYINSPGGVVTSSLAIRDTMDELGLPVQTCCIREAVGTALLLLAHGVPGKRTALPEARFG